MKVILIKSILFSMVIVMQSCGGKESSKSAVRPPVPDPVKIKFDGSFVATVNNQKQYLQLSNTNGIIKGTMKDEKDSFLLTGSVIDEKVHGTFKYALGDMPFTAYYKGPRMIMQLDTAIVNALREMNAMASKDGNNKIEDKVVFDKTDL